MKLPSYQLRDSVKLQIQMAGNVAMNILIVNWKNEVFLEVGDFVMVLLESSWDCDEEEKARESRWLIDPKAQPRLSIINSS